MERFYVNTHGSDNEAARRAVEWLLDKARELGVDRAAIAVPTVDSARSNLGAVIGKEPAHQLVHDRATDVGGLTLELLVKRSTRFAAYEGPILALWAGPEQVATVERLQAPAVCAVPWVESELSDWVRIHNPLELFTGKRAEPESVPPVIIGAVRSMAIGRDIVHPSDKRNAVRALKMLRLVGIPIDPVQIEAEAVRQGWEPDAATRLHTLAEKVAGGRRVQGGGKVTKNEAREALARWESAGFEAESGDPW